MVERGIISTYELPTPFKTAFFYGLKNQPCEQSPVFDRTTKRPLSELVAPQLAVVTDLRWDFFYLVKGATK